MSILTESGTVAFVLTIVESETACTRLLGKDYRGFQLIFSSNITQQVAIRHSEVSGTDLIHRAFGHKSYTIRYNTHDFHAQKLRDSGLVCLYENLKKNFKT